MLAIQKIICNKNNPGACERGEADPYAPHARVSADAALIHAGALAVAVALTRCTSSIVRTA